MATVYNHAQIGVVDASGNVNVIYPQTYAKDVVVEQNSNSYLVSNSITTAQGLAEVVGKDMKAVKDIVAAANAGAHNALYRGVDLAQRSWCGANSDGTITTSGLTALCNRISNGYFEDIYVGDYFKTKITTSFGGEEVVTHVIADLDTYYQCGDTALTKHHAVIVPMNCFKTSHQMNTTNTTGVSQNTENPVGVSAETQYKGYYGSDMRQLVLPVYSAAMASSLNGHLVTSRVLLDNDMNANAQSSGYSGWSGASSSWAWYDSTLELLNEVQVYGENVNGNRYNVGIHKSQLNYFKHNPGAINLRRYWWLRSVAYSYNFAFVDLVGVAGYGNASHSLGVRPLYLLS